MERSSNISDKKFLAQSTMIEKCQTLKYTHKGYDCDICKVEPIKGNRYHCPRCEDYDLCEKCWIEEGHEHEM